MHCVTVNVTNARNVVNLTVTIGNGQCRNMIGSWKIEDRKNDGGKYEETIVNYLVCVLV